MALLCNFSVERIEKDYGYDLILFTYDQNGEIQNGQINLQLKATDSLSYLADGKTIRFSLERRDLDLWIGEPWPVILVVYDAGDDKAYWLYVQAYFENLRGFSLAAASVSHTVHISGSASLDVAAIRAFAQYRDDVLQQVQGVIRHHE